MEPTTKDKILDAAEKLYASQGFGATSLRQVIKEAGVNTASVHYHFGSKEALIEAVLVRSAAPINQERLRRLEELESQHPGETLPLEPLIEAFLGPALRLRDQHARGESPFPKLMGRAVTEADDTIRDIMVSIFDDVVVRFTHAFARALPHVPKPEILSRMHFMIGALAFAVIVPALHPKLARAGGRGTDTADVMKRLVAFAAAGMRAPVEKVARRESR